MAIDLLKIGCTGEELVNKINEIIAAVNELAPITSYDSLSNKPTINGVELSGAKTTASLDIAYTGLSDYATQEARLATKANVATAKEEAISEAASNEENNMLHKVIQNTGMYFIVAGNADGKNNVFSTDVLFKPNSTYVYVDGVLLERGVDYVETDTDTVTLTKAPKEGSVVQITGVQYVKS